MSNVPMTRPEDTIAVHDQNYGHSVAFAELATGRLLLCGGGEFSYSDDGGVTWSRPFKGKNEKGEIFSPSDPSMVRLTGGVIGLSYLRKKPDAITRYESQMMFVTSEDECKTWSSPVVMNQCLKPAHAYQDTLIRTESGRLIQPVYFKITQGREPASWHHEEAPFVGGYLNGNFISSDAHFLDPGFLASYVLYSDDEGKSWTPNRDGELFIQLKPNDAFNKTGEPSIVEVTPGLILMIMRTTLGRMFQAWSEDNGETWSRPAPTQLAGTNAPGQIRKFSNGHLLAVWTQHGEKEIKQGFIRTRLSSAISRNGGGIWEHFQNVESLHEETHVEPGPIRVACPEGRVSGHLGAAPENDAEYIVPLPEGYGRWSYPSVLVTGDRVLISHTYSVHDNKTGEAFPKGGSKLKVLPISWFYGGQAPFDTSVVEKLSQAPKP